MTSNPMIFKRNKSLNHRREATAKRLSPRLAAIVRESWWLLIVAALSYLALSLAGDAPECAGRRARRRDRPWACARARLQRRHVAADRIVRGRLVLVDGDVVAAADGKRRRCNRKAYCGAAAAARATPRSRARRSRDGAARTVRRRGARDHR